jgi:NRPS condensation-like uncharacterized protein
MSINQKKQGSAKKDDWFKLDNAAKIYPPVMSKELSGVFRLSCTLRDPVKIGSLQEAVTITSKRFPYYNVTLRRGFFWYYLECSDNIPTITGEERRPLTAFPVGSVRRSLYRILARGNKISVEFLHVIADGVGAFEFLRTLLVTYIRITGNEMKYSSGVIDPESPIEDEETEDSFNKFYNHTIPKPPGLSRAWDLPYPLARPSKITITEAEISVSELKKKAKEAEVTITDYLAAVYIFSMQKIFLRQNPRKRGASKTIRLEIPINMRNLFPSRTMRNFSLFVMPEIDLRLGEFTFEEILRVVYHYMRTETDAKLIRRIITRNVKPERNFLLRITPLVFKDIVLSFAFMKHGSTKYSSVLTNLGSVVMPEGSEKFIDSFSVIPPPPSKVLKVSCGMVSYGDKMRLTFVNLTTSVELEREILKFHAESGLKVKIINHYQSYDQ